MWHIRDALLSANLGQETEFSDLEDVDCKGYTGSNNSVAVVHN